MDTAPLARSEDSQDYARYWRVWRSQGEKGQPGAWYATKKAGAPEEWAPTLAADSLPALTRLMESPPRRVRTVLSDLVAPQ